MDMEGIRQIGKILKPHGVRGEVKVEPMTHDPKIFKVLDEVIIIQGNTRKKVLIKNSRPFKDRWILLFDGYGNMDEVQAIVGLGLYLEEEKIKPLEEGEFFIDDLIGSEVFSAEDQYLGKIVHYFETGGQGVCEVEKENQSFMFPITQEVVLEILEQENKVVINLLEGLID